MRNSCQVTEKEKPNSVTIAEKKPENKN